MKKAILLDLGGVLVEIAGEREMLKLLGSNFSREQMWARWLASPAVRTHERGEISVVGIKNSAKAAKPTPSSNRTCGNARANKHANKRGITHANSRCNHALGYFADKLAIAAHRFLRAFCSNRSIKKSFS